MSDVLTGIETGKNWTSGGKKIWLFSNIRATAKRMDRKVMKSPIENVRNSVVLGERNDV